MIITTAQQLLIKSELRFWLDSKPTRGMWEVSNVENLSPVVASGRQWSPQFQLKVF